MNFQLLSPQVRREAMEKRIRTYFEGCNEADVEKMAACFMPDAVHYFPPGLPDIPWRGARTIGEKWKWCVENLGSRWTIEHILCDPETNQAVIEWTHWKTAQNTALRGDEWYVFDAQTGLIREIRAYYASPAQSDVPINELAGYDYAGRGYHLQPPAR
jgi:hypothetical protein